MPQEQFESVLVRAANNQLNIAELITTAADLTRAGANTLASRLYKTWLDNNDDSPHRHVAYFNYGITLTSVGDYNNAKDALYASVRFNPEFYPGYINLANILEKVGAIDQAIAIWMIVVNKLVLSNAQNIGYKAVALKQIGRVLVSANQDAQAEDILRQCFEISPEQHDVAHHWIALRQKQCKWPIVEPVGSVSKKYILHNLSPLAIALYADDPILQLATAHRYHLKDIDNCEGPFTVGVYCPLSAHSPDRRLRIGYVSSDLRGHAVGYLTAEIFGLHNRSKVEIFSYYNGIRPDDPIKSRIRNTSDHWVDITTMDDKHVSSMIINDGIDILVDLNGHTKDSRTGVFSLKPAPINVNWLGFPGSMGTSYHHYIIADDYIIPKEYEKYYSERVVRLPCYQPNDRNRLISTQRPTRRDEGLPESALVFCCFNGMQKITRFMFERWMTILREVPDGILWLLGDTTETNQRLRERAPTYGIAPERLFFAGRKMNADHLARFPLADLFLDTSPYGAHTTASDAMWMGVPILALSGRSFPARVCGSLARAAGIEELICYTPDEYVAMAVKLGNDREAIQAFRNRLLSQRDKCTLFDTPLLVRHLEGLYAQMWQEFLDGNLPNPDLRNLEVYQDVGTSLNHEENELLSVPDYEELYHRLMAYRNGFSTVQFDQRLWKDD